MLNFTLVFGFYITSEEEFDMVRHYLQSQEIVIEQKKGSR
jgi:hypothetical protein